jgi:LPXTG-site transpeptidase (sortase) family protein
MREALFFNHWNMPDFPGITTESEISKLLKLGSSSNVPVNLPGADNEIQNPIHPQVKKISAVSGIIGSIKNTIQPYKGFLFYPVIFITSFLFFYFAMNFPSLLASAQGMFVKPQSQEILGKYLEAYNQWISGYFYTVSDKSLLLPNSDIDHDGLTNYEEFIMKTNPTVADSAGTGISDGVKILNGINPWGMGPMTPEQLKLREKINLNMVSERISYYVSANQGQVSETEDSKNFDLNRPGVLTVPKLRIEVPLVWSRDPSTFDADLQNGVIHYPGTALPGNLGVVYVSGHSSDYIWKRDKFATVFTQINRLSPDDDIYITVYGKDGKVYNYRYKVTSQKVYAPDDQTQFIDSSGRKLNLSTCWPIGTAKDRLIVSAQLAPL